MRFFVVIRNVVSEHIDLDSTTETGARDEAECIRTAYFGHSRSEDMRFVVTDTDLTILFDL